MLHIKIKYLQNYSFPKLKKASTGSSCFDLYSCYDIVIPGRGTVAINCGFKLEMSQLVEAQIRSRSGLARKHGVFVLNSPGTIDSDYRGEIGVTLANFSDVDFNVNRGDRIAQMVFVQLKEPLLMEVEHVNETERGEGGFGSTGIRDHKKQLTLGELLSELEKQNQDSYLHFDFCGLSPESFDSYRGKYEDIAIGWSYLKPNKVKVFLEMLKNILDVELSGWKGGSYKMHKDVNVFVDNQGVATNTGVFSVKNVDGKVILETAKIDF